MTDQTPSKKDGRPRRNVNITVGGNVGPGAVLGPNSHVEADNIAGRDIIINHSQIATKNREDFATMLGDLQGLVEQAREKGELSDEDAEKVLADLEIANDLAGQEKPSKNVLLRKLEDISDLLDGAADTIESAGGVARVVLKAIPITALLLKLASYLF